MLSKKHKARMHGNQFPKTCKKAYELGKWLVE